MTPKDMMAVDTNAAALGIPRLSLMENAGRCLADKISEIIKPCKVVIFAGTGGNGGDGFVAARYLLNKGFEVEVFILSNPSRIKSDEARINWDVLQRIDKGLNPLKMYVVEDSSKLKKLGEDMDAGVVVDAILGTGIKGKLREPVSSAIDIINSLKGFKVAVDIPSGLDPLTGEVSDKTVIADSTITFHQAKTGLKNARIEHVGKVQICDIGIPKEAELFTGPGDLLRLKSRDDSSHKGQNGRILVLGGSKDYSGAPAFAAMSSLRSGADISVLACPSSVASSIRSYSPDLIVKTLSDHISGNFINQENVDGIIELSKSADSVVVGCGIGRKDDTAIALDELVCKIEKPLIIDADALKLIDLNVIKKSTKKLGREIVLTPHNAEFKAVFDLNVPQNFENKVETVLEASKSSGCVVLLKGSVDMVSNGKYVKFNATGNPGMTVGGTGDVLAGLVGGLIAQGHDAFEAACLGTYINGVAGDSAASEYGYNFLASDLLRFIPKVFMG